MNDRLARWLLSRLLIAGLAAVLIALGVWAIVSGIDPTVAAAMVTAAVGLAGAIAQRRWEKRQELERLHRQEMTGLYEELITRFKTPDQDPAEVAAFFQRFGTQILIHGPGPIVEAWITWSRAYVPDDQRSLLKWEQMLFAIRADLGHDDSGLSPGDLLRVYVNDVDDQIAAWKTDGTLPKPTRLHQFSARARKLLK
jgi:hypothetical protein